MFLGRVNKQDTYDLPLYFIHRFDYEGAMRYFRRLVDFRLRYYWWYDRDINLTVEYLADSADLTTVVTYDKQTITVRLPSALPDVDKGKQVLKAYYPYEGIGYINPTLGKKWFEQGKTYLTPEDVEELMQYKDDPDSYFQVHNLE